MRRAWAIFVAVLALTVAAEAFVQHHAAFPVERLFGWNALYGFLACAVLILVAKAIGLVLKRRDDYYDD
jgi:Na+/melibiose symporter-like transporter